MEQTSGSPNGLNTNLFLQAGPDDHGGMSALVRSASAGPVWEASNGTLLLDLCPVVATLCPPAVHARNPLLRVPINDRHGQAHLIHGSSFGRASCVGASGLRAQHDFK
eukprot:6196473-Alexandrium_andersonii.AAC.1